MDIENIIGLLERIKEFFFETLCRKVTYWILFTAMAIVGYFAIASIKLLPKPETFKEFFSYLFNNPDNYYSALGLSLLSLLLFLLVGITTMFYGFKLKEVQASLPYLGLIVGVVIIGFGIYFLSYFMRLFGVILIVGVGIITIASSKQR